MGGAGPDTSGAGPSPPSVWPGRRPLDAARGWLAEEGAKGALTAAVSTGVVFGLVLWAVLRSENWDAVQAQFFNPENFVEAWPQVLAGFWLDLQMFAIAQIAILLFALLVAVIRSLRGPAFLPVRLLAVLYIDLFRGVPLILAILLFGFGIPALDLPGVPRSPLFWGVATLVLSYSAYTAEVYRSGIDSVPESQRSSARSLGLTQWQSLRYAILPQAVRNVVPALLNGLVSLQKDVALVSVLGVREAVRAAEIYTSRTFNYTSFVAATVLFLLISVPAARFADWYSARDRARRSQMAA
ncbi:MAG: amino acid ABC transporter permease [Actinobacteria bacterium]|nr:amino acid ABC transporter permease [Actinomycetota bacterium]